MEYDQEHPSGTGKKKIILFVVLPLLLLVGIGVGIFFSGILDKPKEIAETEVQPDKVLYSLPEMLTNISGDGHPRRFLKVRVVLELADKADIARLKHLEPRIIDILQVYLRELRIDDLRGSHGLVWLRQELLARINESVEPAKVSGALFDEILIQ